MVQSSSGKVKPLAAAQMAQWEQEYQAKQAAKKDNPPPKVSNFTHNGYLGDDEDEPAKPKAKRQTLSETLPMSALSSKQKTAPDRLAPFADLTAKQQREVRAREKEWGVSIYSDQGMPLVTYRELTQCEAEWKAKTRKRRAKPSKVPAPRKRYAEAKESEIYYLGLSDGAYRVLHVLKRHQREKASCYLKHMTIANKLGVSRDTVKRKLAELEREGFIEILTNKSGGANTYKVLPRAYLLAE